jgi:hypothetical protein
VFGGALAGFAVALLLLAVQVRAGRDPALGAGAPVAAAPERPRPVVIRRVVRTTVVTRVVRPRRTAPGPAAGAATAAPVTAAASAPATRVSAPAAPAPAPAPAPVTTQAS